MPDGWARCYTDPVKPFSFGELEVWSSPKIVAFFSSAVYAVGSRHESILSPLMASQLRDIALDGSLEAKADLLVSLIIILKKLELFVEEPVEIEPDLEGYSMDRSAAGIRQKVLNVPKMVPPTDPTSQARKFMMEQELQYAEFVPPLPGTPGLELLAHQGQAPLQKLHSFMVGNVTAEVKDMKRDLLMTRCKEWAAERYPKADPTDFKDRSGASGGSNMNKQSYDRTMDLLRKLHIIDSMYGEQCP
jgi:hypothetical protein